MSRKFSDLKTSDLANKADGLASGQCSTEEILYWAKKGETLGADGR